MTHSGVTTKIHNTERIVRIFRKISQAKLKVLARSKSQTSTAVKGQASELRPYRRLDGGMELSLIISNISEQGASHLLNEKEAYFEFVLLASKVQCKCEILQVRSSELILGLPKVLVSTEKRAGNRFKTTDNQCAYLELSCWKAEQTDSYSVPYFFRHDHLPNRLPLKDISKDGICIESLFPSTSMAMEVGLNDADAKLFLPMEPPIDLKIEIRWTKIVRELVKGKTKRKDSRFLIGCRIIDLRPESKPKIMRFIQKLIQADAI